MTQSKAQESLLPSAARNGARRSFSRPLRTTLLCASVFRKTTMDEVAREAGCSRTTLYAHFRNKEDRLWQASFEQDSEAFIARRASAVRSRTHVERRRRKSAAIVEIDARTPTRHKGVHAPRPGPRRGNEPRSRLRTPSRAIRRNVSWTCCVRVLDEGVARGLAALTSITERVAYLMFHLGHLSGRSRRPFPAIARLPLRRHRGGIDG